jgi:hypothetical protein
MELGRSAETSVDYRLNKDDLYTERTFYDTTERRANK